MGSSKQVYVGAYLEIPIRKVQLERISRECANCHLEYHSVRTKFCPTCGTRITNEKTTEVGEPSLYDLMNEDDVLNVIHSVFYQPDIYPENKILLLLNCGKNEEEVVLDEEDVVDLENIDMQSHINAFRRDSTEGLQCLQKYNISYKIKFGIITYWN